MKKIIGLSIAAILVMGLVGGGTWAYFSDTETSTGNTFTAGILDLTASVSGSYTGAGTYTPTAGGNGINGNVVLDDIAPGENGEAIWELVNLGDTSANLTVTLTRTADDDNAFTEPEDSISGTATDNDDGTADGDLDDYMTVEILADLDGDDTYETTIQTSAQGGLETKCPTEDVAVTIINNESMEANGSAGDTIKIKLTWSIASDIPAVDDNIIQSDSVQLDLNFNLVQP